MKPLLPTILFLAINLSACTVYQYATLDSSIGKDEDDQIVLENDTLRLMYSFSGADCQATLRVFNKLKVPLFLDWQRSAFIVGEQALPAIDDKSIINATSVASEFKWAPNFSSSVADVNGTVSKARDKSFIPPGAYVESTALPLQSTFFKIRPEEMEKGLERVHGTSYAYKAKYFSRQTSPFKFRHYLTLSTDQDFDRVFVLDNLFWVSQVVQTGMSPSAYGDIDPGRTDRFYLTEANGAGVFIGTLGLAFITYASIPKE